MRTKAVMKQERGKRAKQTGQTTEAVPPKRERKGTPQLQRKCEKRKGRTAKTG